MRYFWAFRTEPWWEAKRGELWLLGDDGRTRERLASYDVHRVVLGRFSRSARVDADLVDVGSGLGPSDYQGKSVEGKIVPPPGPRGRCTPVRYGSTELRVLPRAIARLERHGGKRGSPPYEESSASLVPVRTPLVSGPVNFFRPEYGLDWMIERTKDPGFVEKVRLARRGHYYLYETLNFADGRRNLAAIRSAVTLSDRELNMAREWLFFRRETSPSGRSRRALRSGLPTLRASS